MGNFCSQCGRPLQEGEVCNCTSQKKQNNNVLNKLKEMFEGPENKKKRTGAIIGAIVAVIVIFIVIILIVNHKKTIDLQDYTKVEFTGYNQYGTAEVNFDYEKFYEDVVDSMKGGDSSRIHNLKEAANLASLGISSFSAVGSVSYKLNKDSKLSNGEKVKVTYRFDNEKAGEIGLKFKGETKEVTVSGLEKVKEFDPFKELKVTFTGVSPNASVEFQSESDDDVVERISYETESTTGIAKGDKVTIKVDYNEDTILQEFGYKLSPTQKDYICNDVDEYIQKYSDISEEYLKTIQEQTQDVLDAYFAQNKDSFTAGSRKFEGAYYLVQKENDTSWGEENILYMIYSATVKSKEKSFSKTKVYFPVKYTNVEKYKDGTCYVDLNNSQMAGNSGLSYGWYSTVTGYVKKSLMYNELVATQKASYTEEVIGDLK